MASIYARNFQSTSNECYLELTQKIQDLVANIISLKADIESSAESNVSHPYGKTFA